MVIVAQNGQWAVSPGLTATAPLFGAYLFDVVILTHHRCSYSMVLDCSSTYGRLPEARNPTQLNAFALCRALGELLAYPGRCPGLTAGCPLRGVLIRETLSLWAGVFEQEWVGQEWVGQDLQSEIHCTYLFSASQMLILNGVGLLIDLWSLAWSKKSDTTANPTQLKQEIQHYWHYWHNWNRL